MLRSGAAHGNYPLGWNVDRDQWLHWSPKLNASEYGFYQNNNTDYTDVESFIGKTVGVFGPSNTQRSLTTIKDKLYRKHKKTFHVSIQPNASGNNMRKLSFGRIDGVFISRDNGNIQLKNLGIDNVNYAFSVKRLNYYIGFSKEKNQGNRKRLIDRFNVSLNSLYKKGVIDKIIKEYGITPLDDSIR